MSDKDRKKKDGHGKSHERRAMREGAEFRKRKASEGDNYIKNEHDIQAFKPGAAGDRNRTGAT